LGGRNLKLVRTWVVRSGGLVFNPHFDFLEGRRVFERTQIAFLVVIQFGGQLLGQGVVGEPEVPLGVPRASGFDRSAYVAGLTFKPIFEVAVKCDYTYRHSEVAGSGTHLTDFALAYQF
jgi:hypothetical protein